MRKKGSLGPAIGNYVVVDQAFLREKANRTHDPRHVFYKAVLEHRSYEKYENAVRGIRISVPSFRTGPITGHMEIMYARRMGWIEDARGMHSRVSRS